MAPRPPSWGCLYLVSVIAGCAAFFVFVTGKFWFDELQPQDRLRGEAQYLYRLATRSEGVRRLQRMNEALPLSFGLVNVPVVLAILGELNEAGVEPKLSPAAMVVPNAVWAAGLTTDDWTLGTQAALFIARNTNPSSVRLVLHWRSASGGRARFRRGSGDWQVFTFSRDGADNLARLELPLPPSGDFELISVAAEVAHLPGNDPRALGIRLERLEWLP